MLNFVKPLRSYSVSGSGKRARKIGDTVGPAFAIFEYAIERGDELKRPLDSCIENPHFTNALLCLMAQGYAERCSPKYPRRCLGAQTLLPVSKSRRVHCRCELSVARLVHAFFKVNETSSSIIVLPMNQGPCSDSARSGPTLEAISTSSRLLVGESVRKTGRKLPRSTFVSAGQC